jgi:hypothetical protein
VVVEPGTDLHAGSIVVVTPFANLNGASYWVTRDVMNDAFTIRLSDTRKRHTPFSWIIVESDMVPE